MLIVVQRLVNCHCALRNTEAQRFLIVGWVFSFQVLQVYEIVV